MFGTGLLVVLDPYSNDDESRSGQESPNEVDGFAEAGGSCGLGLLLFGLFLRPILGGWVLIAEKRTAFVRLSGKVISIVLVATVYENETYHGECRGRG